MLASGGKDLNLRIYDTQTKEVVPEHDGRNAGLWWEGP